MEVTIFKNIRETSTPFIRSVQFVFDRIKNGNSKLLVENVRTAISKEESNALKSDLPSICFSGTFKNRSKNGVIKHSGLICLDFDKYESEDLMNADRAKFIEDKFTFACFVSPSGNGLKLVVKIPTEIENHKLYFEALEKHFNNENFDSAVSDISRVCYESFDPEIYVNNDSETWTQRNENAVHSYDNKAPVVKLDNQSEIIRRLYVWFQKNIGFAEGSRNTNLFKLAASFSDFGIDKFEAIRFCRQFEQSDFTIDEIEAVIQNAYKRGASTFGMKYFEDEEKATEIKKEFKNGKTRDEIKQKFPTLDNSALDKIEESSAVITFWETTRRGIVINHLEYKKFLQSNGFFKFYPEGSESFVFVRIENNLIDNTNEIRIKDFVLSEMLKNGDVHIYQYLAEHPKYFKDEYLNILDPIELQFKEDTITEAYIYFKNGVIRVTSTGVDMIDYIDLNGFVWKKHIIDFEITPTETIDCDFKKFVYLISNKDERRELSIATTLGYLMHSFKTSANNKAVILNDETISENANGGSGKGIFWNALSKVKRVVSIDGKSFTFDKSFPYQTISADTQLIVFDDVQKNFKFENLFSVITEGITLEKKNKDAIKIPVEKSPKILITTNYTIGGVGGSFDRRRWELEFSSYFSHKYTPLNEFGRMLFDEWPLDEWLHFYNYMIRCVQLYLINGLVLSDFNNLDTRKFIKETSFEFYEWTNEKDVMKEGERLFKSQLFSMFCEEFPDWKKFNLSQRRFSSWLDKYADFKGYDVTRSQDAGGDRYILLTKNN